MNKRRIINEYDKKVNQLELSFANSLRNYFLKLEKEMLKEVSATTTYSDFEYIINQNWEKYINIIYEYTLQSHRLGETLYSLLTQPSQVVKSKDIILPFTIEWELRELAKVSSTYVQLRYGKLINNALIIGYEQGLGIGDTTKLLQRINNNFKNYEAHRIARTEIQSSRNRAVHEQMVNEQVELKQWLTMTDELVRGNKPTDNADHVILEGIIVPVDEPFPNGLMYPGDKNGPIEEWINCRCTSVPYILLPNESAPIGATSFYEHEISRV